MSYLNVFEAIGIQKKSSEFPFDSTFMFKIINTYPFDNRYGFRFTVKFRFPHKDVNVSFLNQLHGMRGFVALNNKMYHVFPNLCQFKGKHVSSYSRCCITYCFQPLHGCASAGMEMGYDRLRDGNRAQTLQEWTLRVLSTNFAPSNG